MGILGLSKLIYDAAPASVKENEFKNYFGRKVAIDATMSLYQFLIAVRQEGAQLMSADGETTSHLSGFFYRTIRMIEAGIKPIYVFDGKPPEMKSGELEKRQEKRADAQKAYDTAVEAGNVEEIDKQSRRLVKVTKAHVDEAQYLLTLMGIPFVKAPCEAEAQCAALQAAGKVYAVATEDMDALTFGSKVMLRHLTFSEARKMPIQEFYLSKVLEGLEFTMDEFIDLCILLGCDYCPSIRGIGPKKAIELMKVHRNIEGVIEHIKKENIRKLEEHKRSNKEGKKPPTLYVIPEPWHYDGARGLFKAPEITDPETFDFKWNAPDLDGLVEYMVNEKGFAEERIRSGCKKLTNARQTSTQGRLDGFFKVIGTTTAAVKRPADDKKGGSQSKKSKDDKKGKTGGAKRGGGSGFKRGK